MNAASALPTLHTHTHTHTYTDTHRAHYPITQTVLSFTHKHLWIITKNLTKKRVCLRDPDFTTTSICQQPISIILWITSMTQPSPMPHVPNSTIGYWPKPLYTTCRLEVCKTSKLCQLICGLPQVSRSHHFEFLVGEHMDECGPLCSHCWDDNHMCPIELLLIEAEVFERVGHSVEKAHLGSMTH